MRNILLAIMVAVLPLSSAMAEPSGARKPDKSATEDRLLPVKRSAVANSCAAYGAGFVKLEGTDTCVKIGGAVSIGVGGTSARGRAFSSEVETGSR
jgi:predicted secreted protein